MRSSGDRAVNISCKEALSGLSKKNSRQNPSGFSNSASTSISSCGARSDISQPELGELGLKALERGQVLTYLGGDAMSAYSWSSS